MSEPSVIVTGANGFIGGNLVRHFHARGWRVRALARQLPSQRLEGVDYYAYNIGESPAESALKGARFLVHCAYVRHNDDSDSDRINVDGARALLASCRSWGVKPLFLSSFSAHEGARSHYGKAKLATEAIFDPAVDLILRPGLVIGRGGLFGAMCGFIASRRYIPLVGSGTQPLQTIAVDDLCLIIERGLDKGICGLFAIAHPAPTTLRSIYEAVASHLGKKRLLIPVPIWLLLSACRVAEFLRIRLPVNSDSVLGLKHARFIDTARDLEVFGVAPKTLADCLRAMEPPCS
jgi:nucleoside-diphosphate-sugar epimerase